MRTSPPLRSWSTSRAGHLRFQLHRRGARLVAVLGPLDHAWKDGLGPRLLTSQTAIHEARDAGDLDEFIGVPDTAGEIFTVNCPVPVLAPNTFEPA
jgi:hypothetical protein